MAPGQDLKFTKVMLEPIEVFMHEKSLHKGFNAGDIGALSERFVGPRGTGWTTPSFRVPVRAWRWCVSQSVASNSRKRSEVCLATPVGFVATTAMEGGKRLSLIDATIEAEVLDSASGERVAAGGRQPRKARAKNDWSDVEARLKPAVSVARI